MKKSKPCICKKQKVLRVYGNHEEEQSNPHTSIFAEREREREKTGEVNAKVYFFKTHKRDLMMIFN